LDDARAEWRARVDSYRVARDAIAADPTLSDQDRSQAIERLRADRFSPTEQIRIAALDARP
jgi:lipase chaperone LimK